MQMTFVFIILAAVSAGLGIAANILIILRRKMIFDSLIYSTEFLLADILLTVLLADSLNYSQSIMLFFVLLGLWVIFSLSLMLRRKSYFRIFGLHYKNNKALSESVNAIVSENGLDGDTATLVGGDDKTPYTTLVINADKSTTQKIVSAVNDVLCRFPSSVVMPVISCLINIAAVTIIVICLF